MPVMRKITEQEVGSALPDITALTRARQFRRQIKDAAKADPEYGFNLADTVFYELMYQLSPQSYGSRIEQHFAKKLGLLPVSSSLGRGDNVDPKTNEYSETKVSISEDNSYNVVQIRLHHNLDYYYFVFIDMSGEVAKRHAFKIPANELHQFAINWSLAHGTKINTSNNETVELRQTIHVNDATWIWLQQYRLEI